MEMRRVLGIDIGDPFEYFVEEADERLILRKYRTLECMFCASTEGLSYFKDYFICGSCLPEGGGLFNPEVAATLEEINTEIIIKPKWVRSKETLLRLTKAMEQYPDAPQKKWAELVGVSQGRVSQLVRDLNNTARRSPGSGEE
ncbi:AbrB family transcriptional regulator [Paenibacillus sp. LMG 31459]|uniref:AbrB family transcriptional regulator n=1 Tax=Paenibacillus phytohabitans TaxID=2654978 RepID=A0ABX1YMU5_9BACL|nr:AbrB/MazE/SpoVT family DNA-binding domain-containing protein [Paenibacillus phytohabitans]NOU81173.1 AbrB family transcriptional regulator [Paenibacillus phytohabitans]